MEEFIAPIRKDGKITVPKALRDRFNLADGNYIRLAVLEVHKKSRDGTWTK